MVHRITQSFIKLNMSNKSDFILKITGTCIDCIFRNQSMFLKIETLGKHIERTMTWFIQ